MAATSTLPISHPTLSSTSHNTSNELHHITQIEPTSASAESSRPSSIDSRQVDSIPEEDEYETSSGAVNEPVTPTEFLHPHQHTRVITNDLLSQQEIQDSEAKSRSFFRRSNSQSGILNTTALNDQTNLTDNNGSDPMLGKEHRRMSIGRASTSTTAFTSRTNTPPSPTTTPSEPQSSQENISISLAPSENFNMSKKQRSSTGLSIGLMNRFQNHGPKIAFATTSTQERAKAPQRATSVDWDFNNDTASEPGVQEMSREPWAMPAETGNWSKDVAGSKSVKVPQLHVKLVVKNGTNDTYAVKEFRGKSTTEKEEDYEKKVKSEYSIAKAAHHPNIVQTFRLCTHNGRAAGGKCGKDMTETRLCAPGICGSPPYIAPEVLEKQGEYDPRPLDVWSAAIVMLCMTANGCLWERARPNTSPLYDELVRGWDKWNDKHDVCTITDSDYPHVSFFDKHINPPALRRILLTMLNPNPKHRASIADIAKNRWMKNVECCQIDSYDEPTKVIDASKCGVGNRSLHRVWAITIYHSKEHAWS
ncbi:hypothetical protein DID88_001470 [Monilinia fructigena]|uniref:non-specific serine/threonine protein kinase n=1 Tax=Monilinia fructigena TaxID=38457 RepID=A0A395IX65_9HELO|nr:hypothetical protein DID88_001470 [Monilinia fructigena]